MLKLNQIITKSIILSVLISLTHTYIDITLEIATSSSDIFYNIPLQINQEKHMIGLSLENKQEFIVNTKNSKTHAKSLRTKHINNSNAELHVSSLEGYTLQGWRRFFMEVFTFADSKYQHRIELDISQISKVQKVTPLTGGLMTLGPQITQNKFYQLIKQQTKAYFKDDIVSFYTTPGGKNLKLQLGGYEQQNARGYKNGIRFIEKPIQISEDKSKWLLPVSKLVITKEKGVKWDSFTIPSSNIKPKLTLQSQFVILPKKFKQDLQTSFQTQSIECSFSTSSLQLQCENISSVDQALTFLSFYIDANVSLNISLYDLRDQYNPKSKVTSFFIKIGEQETIQIGSPLLKGYYFSLDITKQSILFSPINRFTPQITTVSILRFIIVFVLFMLAACVCIIIWQQFSNPDKARRFTRGKDGVKLVAYQRANQFEEED